MRLGSYPCVLKEKTIAEKAYTDAGWGKVTHNKRIVNERHRHRYEVNTEYLEQLKKSGLLFSGTSPNGKLMEIAELPKTNP